jgi:hypothetical protein
MWHLWNTLPYMREVNGHWLNDFPACHIFYNMCRPTTMQIFLHWCHAITTAYRNIFLCRCRSPKWHFVGLNPWAYALRERPVRQRILLNSIMSLFCSLPDQHQGWRRRSIMFRRRVFRWPRWPAGPASLQVLEAVGLGNSKAPSVARSQGENCLKMLLPSSWSSLVDSKKCLGTAKW